VQDCCTTARLHPGERRRRRRRRSRRRRERRRIDAAIRAK